MRRLRRTPLRVRAQRMLACGTRGASSSTRFAEVSQAIVVESHFTVSVEKAFNTNYVSQDNTIPLPATRSRAGVRHVRANAMQNRQLRAAC